MAVKKKKQNIFQAYFANFGAKQISDFMFFAGAVCIIVGLCVVYVVATIGMGLYFIAALLTIFSCLKVVNGGANKRSPEYARAKAKLIIVSIILALAIVGLVYSFTFGFSQLLAID